MLKMKNRGGKILGTRPSLAVICFLACFQFPLSANAAELLSQEQARAKAIAILQGNPYGNTLREVAGRMVEAQLITAGTVCRGVKVRSPLWEFHVVVPENVVPDGNGAIDGYLVIDGRSGKMVCAGLPFLD